MKKTKQTKQTKIEKEEVIEASPRDIHSTIIENEQERRKLFVMNCKFLKQLHNSKGYKEIVGEDDAPWTAYLSQIEVFYSRNEIYRILKITKKFDELGISYSLLLEVPFTRLMQMVPLLTEKNFTNWVDKAKALTRQDFEIELRQAKGLPTGEEDDHKHNMESFDVCTSCGKKIRT